jgi:hypothetical protein
METSSTPSNNNSYDEIQLGEVEDASDDECEDELSSVWSNFCRFKYMQIEFLAVLL